MMIERDLARSGEAARQFPAVTLAGPRQSGKSTLCRHLFPHLPYASLEMPDAQAFATEDPRAFLARLPEGAIIDEVQRVPDLPCWLQGIIDADPEPGAGSRPARRTSRCIRPSASRWRAVPPCSICCRCQAARFCGSNPIRRHSGKPFLPGGYPRIFDRNLDPAAWLRSCVGTYIEGDVRRLIDVGDLPTFQCFVELCAGRTAQGLNYAVSGTGAPPIY